MGSRNGSPAKILQHTQLLQCFCGMMESSQTPPTTTMQIEARIISAHNSRLLHKIDVIDSHPGLTPSLIEIAENEAREWAAQQGMRVITDTFSQGAYRAWVEPV